jgi:hypothetical protein
MNNHQAFHELNASERSMMTGHVINHAVDSSACTAEQVSIFRKEITMHAHRQSTGWGTHIGVGQATDVRGWFQQLKAWLAAYQAARHQAKLSALNARWKATREAVTPCWAEAAPEMAAQHHAISIAMMLHGLSQ